MQEAQRYWFGIQLDLAEETGLPVIIHSRDAAEDTMQVMKEHKAQEIPGVIHCYSYSKELAGEFVKMGYFIAVGGVVTFKNARKAVQVAQWLPLERILIETDSPYIAPQPYRGRRNDSRYVPLVAQQIARLREVPPQTVEQATTENARRLFGITE